MHFRICHSLSFRVVFYSFKQFQGHTFVSIINLPVCMQSHTGTTNKTNYKITKVAPLPEIQKKLLTEASVNLTQSRVHKEDLLDDKEAQQAKTLEA